MKIKATIPAPVVKALKIACAKPDECPSLPYLRSLILQIDRDRVLLLGTDGFIFAAYPIKTEITDPIAECIAFPLSFWPKEQKRAGFELEAVTCDQGLSVSIKSGSDPASVYTSPKIAMEGSLMSILPPIKVTGDPEKLIPGDKAQGISDHYEDQREIEGYGPAIFSPEAMSRLYAMQKTLDAKQTLVLPRGLLPAPFGFSYCSYEVRGIVMPLRINFDDQAEQIKAYEELRTGEKTPETK